MNADPQRSAIQSKSFMIITQKGSLSDSKNLKNWAVLNKEMPAENFEVIVEASLQIERIGSQLGIVLYADDQNFLWAGLNADNYYGGVGYTPYFLKSFQGKVDTYPGEGKAGAISQPLHIFLKLERDGVQYSGSYALPDKPGVNPDELRWIKMGSLPWLNFHGKFALCANNFQDGASEVAAQFYSVLVRKK